MSRTIAEQTSLFRSQIKNKRFGEETFRILESVLVSKDVDSLLELRSSLKKFLRSESLSVMRQIAEKTVDQKLLILEFFVGAFALIGDVESCLALRYEALALRELKSSTYQWLQVSYMEWLNFAEHSLDNGYHSIASKACENALLCFQRNDISVPKTDDHYQNVQVIGRIKRLKDVALASSAPRSVQAQAAEYLKRKSVEKGKPNPSFCKQTQCASTLFKNGITKRNARLLHKRQSLHQITSEAHSFEI